MQIFLHTPEHRPLDPSELAILISKANFDDPRFARFRLLSTPMDDFRHPQRPDRDQRVGQRYRHAHGVKDVKG
jgi:hypothetical protein